MKKKIFSYILLLLFAINLTACGKQNTEKQNNSTSQTTEQKKQNPQVVNTMQVENNDRLLQENTQIFTKIEKQTQTIIEKQNPKIIKVYNIYNNSTKVLSQKLGENPQVVAKTITKITPYLVKYKQLKEELNKNPNNKVAKQKLEKYKKFIEKNLKRNGINMDDKKFDDLVENNYKDIVVVYKTSKQLGDYLLPDGTLTTKDFKQSFEDFKQQLGPNVPDEQALEMFQQQLVTETLTMNGQCDKIINEIDRAYCESMQK